MPRTFKKLEEVINKVNSCVYKMEINYTFLKDEDRRLERQVEALKDILRNLLEYLDVEVKKVEKQEEHYTIVPKKKTNGRKT